MIHFIIIFNRSSKRSTSSGSSLLNCTKSLGRAQGLQYLRQGDARRNDGTLEDWDPEQDAKATTMSRDNSGRGSIRSVVVKSVTLVSSKYVAKRFLIDRSPSISIFLVHKL